MKIAIAHCPQIMNDFGNPLGRSTMDITVAQLEERNENYDDSPESNIEVLRVYNDNRKNQTILGARSQGVLGANVPVNPNFIDQSQGIGYECRTDGNPNFWALDVAMSRSFTHPEHLLGQHIPTDAGKRRYLIGRRPQVLIVDNVGSREEDIYVSRSSYDLTPNIFDDHLRKRSSPLPDYTTFLERIRNNTAEAEEAEEE